MSTTVRPPFFEIGPKAYLAGEEVIDLAIAADRAAAEHDVQVYFTSPLLELAHVAEATSHLIVQAPHMDPIERGRGVADILPESLLAAGVRSVLLNHVERPVTFATLASTVERAKQVGLMTMVCASSIAEIKACALLGPDIIVAEPTELIGTGKTSDADYMRASAEAVHSIDPSIHVLQAAGIKNGDDVFRTMSVEWADGTGSSSGISKAPDPGAKAAEMIAAARHAFNERPNNQ